eukprot:5981654-Prymnesium_polylepis.1
METPVRSESSKSVDTSPQQWEGAYASTLTLRRRGEYEFCVLSFWCAAHTVDDALDMLMEDVDK